MSKTILIQKDEESGEYYFDITELPELSDLFEDSSIIDTYSVETNDDGSIIVEFFDKDGNKVKPIKA